MLDVGLVVLNRLTHLQVLDFALDLLLIVEGVLFVLTVLLQGAEFTREVFEIVFLEKCFNLIAIEDVDLLGILFFDVVEIFLGMRSFSKMCT